MAKRTKRADDREENITVDEELEPVLIIDEPKQEEVIIEPVSSPSSELPPPLPSPDEPAVIPLKVFAKIAGPKWDQMAGFLAWARANAMGPRTVGAWRAAHQDFLRRPVR